MIWHRRGLTLIAKTIFNDDIVAIDTLLPVVMVRLLSIATGKCCGRNDRNQPELNTSGALLH
jgi:hypothetical protein